MMTTLITLRPGVSFEAAAAASWARMEAERGRSLDVNRSTVSRAEQQQKRDAYLAYRAFLNGGRWAPWAPLALPPDQSWHCLPIARAADTDDDGWIRAHPDHGWRFVVRDEAWHAQYYPEHDKHRSEAPAGGGGKPPVQEEEEEEDMAKTTGLSWKRSRDGVTVFALTNPVSGYWSEWEGADGGYNNKVAAGFDTGDFVPVTEGHAGALYASAQAVRM